VEIVQTFCVHVVVMNAVDVRTDRRKTEGFLRAKLDKAEQG
jgi:hypothetical protein